MMLFAVAAFAVGAWVGSDGAIGGQLLRVLAAMGAPQYDAYKDLYAAREAPEGGKETDYLLFFEHDAHNEQQQRQPAKPSETR